MIRTAHRPRSTLSVKTTMSHCYRLAALLLTTIAVSACAPRFYERSTVVFDTPDDEAIQVRYGELDGCLLRQQVPVEYILRRPRYTLLVRPVAGLDSAPRIELRLQSDSDAKLVFPTLAVAPPPLFADKGSRYLVDTTEITDSLLQVEVRRGSESLGQEALRFSATRCRVLSPTG